MDLDIVAMLYQCRAKVGDREDPDYKNKVEICFCKMFIEELKKVKGEDLAPHFDSATYDTKTREQSVVFSFPV